MTLIVSECGLVGLLAVEVLGALVCLGWEGDVATWPSWFRSPGELARILISLACGSLGLPAAPPTLRTLIVVSLHVWYCLVAGICDEARILCHFTPLVFLII